MKIGGELRPGAQKKRDFWKYVLWGYSQSTSYQHQKLTGPDAIKKKLPKFGEDWWKIGAKKRDFCKSKVLPIQTKS